MDGIINLPGYLAGLPEEAYLSEFVAAPGQEEVPEEDPEGGLLPGEETFPDGDLGIETAPLPEA